MIWVILFVVILILSLYAQGAEDEYHGRQHNYHTYGLSYDPEIGREIGDPKTRKVNLPEAKEDVDKLYSFFDSKKKKKKKKKNKKMQVNNYKDINW